MGEAKPSPAGETGGTAKEAMTDSAGFATAEADEEDQGGILWLVGGERKQLI